MSAPQQPGPKAFADDMPSHAAMDAELVAAAEAAPAKPADPAEVVARAHHEALVERLARAQHRLGYGASGWPAWDKCPPPYRADQLRQAREWLAAIKAAGLTVLNQPEWGTEEHDRRHLDAWADTHEGYSVASRQTVVRCLWCDYVAIGPTRKAAMEKYKQQHEWLILDRAAEGQTQPVHDGSGPPICEPCSANCPACAAGNGAGKGGVVA